MKTILLQLLLQSAYSFHAALLYRYRGTVYSSLSEKGILATPQNEFSAFISSTKRRDEVANFIDTVLYPQREYANRAQSSTDEDCPMLLEASDPRTFLSYGEFPLGSFDCLLEEAEKYHSRHPNVLVDLGSGTGRLVLYAALCGHQGSCKWGKVHGVEIGKGPHDVALQTLEKGINEGYFQAKGLENDTSSVHFHHGPAQDYNSIFSEADIVFSYSTVFESKGFNVDLGAMVLADEWSSWLSEVCRPGCVIVTTDRALNPEHGWELKSTLDVDNPALLGSTGYISILRDKYHS